MKNTLTERETEVIIYLDVLEFPRHLNHTEIAEIYGVTKERIRQIEAKAREKIRVLSSL